jgi:hypothetical protein
MFFIRQLCVNFAARIWCVYAGVLGVACLFRGIF